VVGFIQDLAPSENISDEAVAYGQAFVDLLGSEDEQVQWKARPDASANPHDLLDVGASKRHDDQQIDVGISRGLPVCVRTEEDDLLRVKLASHGVAKGPNPEPLDSTASSGQPRKIPGALRSTDQDRNTLFAPIGR
jgi:hypothetical protein